MTKKRRIFAAVLCLALLFVMASAAAYIVLETHHDCIGDGCPICRELQLCRQVLQTMGTAAAAPAVCAAAALLFVSPAVVRVHAVQAGTLISLKVKLSD